MVSDKRMFSCFPYISLRKICDPRGSSFYCPRGHTLNNLGRGPLGNAIFQIFRFYAFCFQTRSFFSRFTYVSLCKICDQKTGSVWPQTNKNKYQYSRSCGFRQKRLMRFPYIKVRNRQRSGIYTIKHHTGLRIPMGK